jgi:hypothetical protein
MARATSEGGGWATFARTVKMTAAGASVTRKHAEITRATTRTREAAFLFYQVKSGNVIGVRATRLDVQPLVAHAAQPVRPSSKVLVAFSKFLELWNKKPC